MMMLELSCNLDAELAHYDLLMGNIMSRNRKEPTPPRRPAKKKRSCWVKSWLLLRPYYGQYRLVMEELRLKDVSAFKNFTRMTPDLFYWLLDKLVPRIQKQDTFWRSAIEPGVRLALTLRFFATGDSYMSLSYSWLVAHNTISKIVRDVAEAIIEEFGQDLLSPPVTADKWQEVAAKFERRWNFPHVLGAIDGKHVAIRCPKSTGSIYYNYKGFYSIVMLALVDGDYRFIWVDAGSNGACSDAQIWNACVLKQSIDDEEIGIPDGKPVVEGEQDVPYFLVGDDAFALRPYLQKPHSKRDLERDERIFNYRLSRARRIVENAFGILANRFGCLLTTLRLEPKTCTSVVLACCCLHNILRDHTVGYLTGNVDEEDKDHNLIPAPWRRNKQLLDGRGDGARNTASQQGKGVRDYLTTYFSAEGAVEWQDRMVV